VLGEFVDVPGVGEALEFVEEAEGLGLQAGFGPVAVRNDGIDLDAHYEGL
jgi:hypothetical protein